jgi:hypothetical protein
VGKRFTLKPDYDDTLLPSGVVVRAGQFTTITDAAYAALPASVLASLTAPTTVADPVAGAVGSASFQSNLQPTTGYYTQGSFVFNTVPVVTTGKVLLGWMRLTSGSAHVAGTDWTTLYCTTT